MSNQSWLLARLCSCKSRFSTKYTYDIHTTRSARARASALNPLLQKNRFGGHVDIKNCVKNRPSNQQSIRKNYRNTRKKKKKKKKKKKETGEWEKKERRKIKI